VVENVRKQPVIGRGGFQIATVRGGAEQVEKKGTRRGILLKTALIETLEGLRV
jgi:hypothetical protein